MTLRIYTIEERLAMAAEELARLQDGTHPALIEQDGGQLSIAADVEEPGGQLVLEELARPAIPAPLNHTPEHPADDLRQQLTSQEA